MGGWEGKSSWVLTDGQRTTPECPTSTCTGLWIWIQTTRCGLRVYTPTSWSALRPAEQDLHVSRSDQTPIKNLFQVFRVTSAGLGPGPGPGPCPPAGSGLVVCQAVLCCSPAASRCQRCSRRLQVSTELRPPAGGCKAALPVSITCKCPEPGAVPPPNPQDRMVVFGLVYKCKDL